jgi:hypothetical protein
MTHAVHVVFDEADAANRAAKRLDAAAVDEPVEQFVARPPMRQDQFSVFFSQARPGAVLGAVMTGTAGATVAALAVMGQFVNIPVYAAALIGVVGGALYGAVLGALAGATEPNATLRRLRRRMKGKQAAFVARFQNAQDVRAAEAILLDAPGAQYSL